MKDLKQALLGFTGSETFYRHTLARGFVYTEGVQYLAENAGAYWLVDKILINQLDQKLRSEPFQVWKLTVDQDKYTASLICDDGDGRELFREELHFTDFPLSEISLYLTDNTLLLPGEY